MAGTYLTSFTAVLVEDHKEERSWRCSIDAVVESMSTKNFL